ncbi:protein translocase subunit SecD [bacterium]|nr:protein translocase subunit SecD [bacterium]
MNRSLAPRFAILAFVMIGAYLSMYPLQDKIKLGLDLKGGILLSMEVETEHIPEDKVEEEVDKAMQIIRNRIDQFGLSSPGIGREGSNKIVVELPGEKDPERAKAVIGKTARLEFRLVNDDLLASAVEGNVPEGYELIHTDIRDPVTHERTETRPVLVESRVLMTAENLERAYPTFDQITGMPNIAFNFNDAGATQFGEITSRNVNRRLAIILDGVVQSAPVIRSAILGGHGVIEGRFTMEEAKDLAVVLNAGALPAEIRIIEERAVGPSLGLDSIVKGLWASALGFALTVGFVVVWYRFAGLIATVALLANIILVLGSMALMGGTLTLPGIAGLLLTVAMAVDANVLVYERIKEELRSGHTLRTAVDAGFSRAFMTILDSNLTTFITAVVLYKFGAGPVRGFAVTLMVGILASMFTALFGCRTLFLFCLRNPRMLRMAI